MTFALLAILLAADVPQLFSDANAAYLSGDLARASASYEALVAEGMTSSELETNLGAAWLRQGKRGLAALHFERALVLDPGDDDARADLLEVRRGNVDKLEGESEEGEAGHDVLLQVKAGQEALSGAAGQGAEYGEGAGQGSEPQKHQNRRPGTTSIEETGAHGCEAS